jgi:hypothetical protein
MVSYNMSVVLLCYAPAWVLSHGMKSSSINIHALSNLETALEHVACATY